MNFLSHFYFDRYTANCHLVLGTVMPDLLKNADKNIILHPEKLIHPDPQVDAIITGWKKHLQVDRYFHSSDFFAQHSHRLKKQLAPVIKGSPVKPFFLGHIALELLLDNLLLTTGKVTTASFYAHLEGCQTDVIREFLSFSGLEDADFFFRFFADFKKSRYLATYTDTKEIAYALKRICMRVWKNPFTDAQEAAMNIVLTSYRSLLYNSFMAIFDEIDARLGAADEAISAAGNV